MNAAFLLGPWIEYLCQFFAESLQTRYQQLSPKSRSKEPPQIYWVEAASHSNFEYLDQQIREVYTKCLDATCTIHEYMRVLKIREFWDKHDDSLVQNNQFTKHGISSYWKALDASFKFNLKKREEFIVCNKFRAMKSNSDNKVHEQKMNSAQEDTDPNEMQNFFHRRCQFDGRERNQNDYTDRFHWRRPLVQQDDDGPRFLLPRLKKSNKHSNLTDS